MGLSCQFWSTWFLFGEELSSICWRVYKSCRTGQCVTKLSWFTPTRQLLNQCNWMSVLQLIQYHSILQIQKVLKAKTPLYLSSKLVTDHPYQTRQATGGGLRHTAENSGRSGLAQKSFFGRAHIIYNTVPLDIRTTQSLPAFKKKLRVWIRSNIPVT